MEGVEREGTINLFAARCQDGSSSGGGCAGDVGSDEGRRSSPGSCPGARSPSRDPGQESPGTKEREECESLSAILSTWRWDVRRRKGGGTNGGLREQKDKS